VTQVIIHTDGACRGNPGPGGWGAKLQFNDTVKEVKGAELQTTNNRMELLAVARAVESLTRPCEVKLITDSRYVMQGITSWLDGWKRNGWRTAAKKPVKNQDLWEMLDNALQPHLITWQWVKGHSGDAGNERADTLANLAIDELLKVSRK
jgi:ribonuclease HI